MKVDGHYAGPYEPGPSTTGVHTSSARRGCASHSGAHNNQVNGSGYISRLGSVYANVVQNQGFGPFLQFFANNFCRLSLHPPPPYGGIFGKRKKRALQACMGHGGVGLHQKNLCNVGCRRVRVFLPILSWPTQIFTRLGSYFQPYFQVFNPETF